MTTRSFRWSRDGGLTWTYETQALPFTLIGTSAEDHVIVEPIGQAVSAPPQETHVFILAGQSNMVGRPSFDGGAGYPAGTLQVARAGAASGGGNGALVPAASPLDHWDAAAGDMGLALQFTIDYLAAHRGRRVVLLPAARGGTGFLASQWGVGNSLSEDLIARANALFAAYPDFLLKGILWHQGESDVNNTGYAAALDAQFAEFRSRITAASATTPIVIGQLGRFYTGTNSARLAIQSVIDGTPARVGYLAVASSQGLTDQGDSLHFDAASLRVFGTRYHLALAEAVANAPVAALPDAVSGVSAVAGDGQILLQWSAPATNGSTLTGYVLNRSIDNGLSWTGTQTVAAGQLSHNLTGLVNGQSYLLRVAAQTAQGQGAWSAVVSATPQAVVVPDPEPEPSGEVGILGYGFASSIDDLTRYTFGLDLPAGDLVLACVARGGTNAYSGPSALQVGGVGATEIVTHTITTEQQHSFWHITRATGGPVQITVDFAVAPRRIGLHGWSLEGGALAQVTHATARSGAASLDVTARGVILAVESYVAAGNLTWTGASMRQVWVDYGDTFGSGAADLAITADGAGHVVEAVATNTANLSLSGVSVLHIPAA